MDSPRFSRRRFLTVSGAALMAPGLCPAAQADGVLGQGDFRYRIVPGWGVSRRGDACEELPWDRLRHRGKPHPPHRRGAEQLHRLRPIRKAAPQMGHGIPRGAWPSPRHRGRDGPSSPTIQPVGRARRARPFHLPPPEASLPLPLPSRIQDPKSIPHSPPLHLSPSHPPPPASRLLWDCGAFVEWHSHPPDVIDQIRMRQILEKRDVHFVRQQKVIQLTANPG